MNIREHGRMLQIHSCIEIVQKAGQEPLWVAVQADQWAACRKASWTVHRSNGPQQATLANIRMAIRQTGPIIIVIFPNRTEIVFQNGIVVMSERIAAIAVDHQKRNRFAIVEAGQEAGDIEVDLFVGQADCISALLVEQNRLL